ncbi:carcinine hydrolase/isopenicillin-N N-acyltransferase family protein [Halobacteriota archaeon]
MGCTIGVVFSKPNKVILFKNRDLDVVKENPEPVIEQGSKYRYIKFGVDIKNQIPGVWAGVNEEGVAILGADGNCILNFEGNKYGDARKTWEAYEEVLANTKSIEEAYKLLIDFYTMHNIGGTGDIVLVTDRTKAVVLEYSLNLWGIQFIIDQPYAVRTNFFNILKHLRPPPEENSLHLSSAKRYERTIELLSKKSFRTTVDDIKQLCRDHLNGPSNFSICRHGGKEEHKTLCSSIIEISDEEIIAHYIMNQFPCESDYRRLSLT